MVSKIRKAKQSLNETFCTIYSKSAENLFTETNYSLHPKSKIYTDPNDLVFTHSQNNSPTIIIKKPNQARFFKENSQFFNNNREILQENTLIDQDKTDRVRQHFNAS